MYACAGDYEPMKRINHHWNGWFIDYLPKIKRKD